MLYALLAGIALVLAVITAIVYTYAALVQKPVSIPVIALMILLWAYSVALGYALVIVVDLTINNPSGRHYGMTYFLFIVVVGYILFLFGSFKKNKTIHTKGDWFACLKILKKK